MSQSSIPGCRPGGPVWIDRENPLPKSLNQAESHQTEVTYKEQLRLPTSSLGPAHIARGLLQLYYPLQPLYTTRFPTPIIPKCYFARTVESRDSRAHNVQQASRQGYHVLHILATGTFMLELHQSLHPLLMTPGRFRWRREALIESRASTFCWHGLGIHAKLETITQHNTPRERQYGN